MGGRGTTCREMFVGGEKGYHMPEDVCRWGEGVFISGGCYDFVHACKVLF